MIDYSKDRFMRSRRRMIEKQIIQRGITDKRIIDAISRIPRHLFVEEALQSQAYSDFPLPIGEGQTISQPYIVALMTDAMELKGDESVLEIGTGSGYQAAVLSLLAERVFSVERVSKLASRARKLFDEMGLSNILIKIGDGSLGWPEHSPFDAILVAAASPDIPKALIEQIVIGGRLVIPVGSAFSQELLKIVKKDDKTFVKTKLGQCRFVKLIGEHAWKD